MTVGVGGTYLEHIHYTHHTRLRYAFAFIGKDTQLFNWTLWYLKTPDENNGIIHLFPCPFYSHCNF